VHAGGRAHRHAGPTRDLAHRQRPVGEREQREVLGRGEALGLGRAGGATLLAGEDERGDARPQLGDGVDEGIEIA
jgi:hypothetical protein